MDRQIPFHLQLFSVPESASYLNVSQSFVYKLLAQGSIKRTKIGHRTLITGAQLLKAATPVAEV
jgi:excisionase family DNA binding protein